MIENEPATVRSRGRIYLSASQRRRCSITGPQYGQGTTVTVVVTVVDRDPEWGMAVERAAFRTTVGYYGEITVPADARERLGLSEGDAVRLAVANTADESAISPLTISRTAASSV